ncbi:MAG: HutD family protein [Aquincola sp.]|nr:HutD family protein [Aquincola sp.]MDH4289783.1 HutD family protein [Aquincola sp.]
MNKVALADCPFVPWRNGGGRTRELLAWPSATDWTLRVSVAEIEADGPFSPFAEIDRCFAVLDGAGVVLSLPRGEVRLHRGDPALTFPGEAAPLCRLIDGPTRDLNLMVRRAAGRPAMQRAPSSSGLWRGLFSGDTLYWSDDPRDTLSQRDGWWLSMEAR